MTGMQPAGRDPFSCMFHLISNWSVVHFDRVPFLSIVRHNLLTNVF